MQGGKIIEQAANTPVVQAIVAKGTEVTETAKDVVISTAKTIATNTAQVLSTGKEAAQVVLETTSATLQTVASKTVETAISLASSAISTTQNLAEQGLIQAAKVVAKTGELAVYATVQVVTTGSQIIEKAQPIVQQLTASIQECLLDTQKIAKDLETAKKELITSSGSDVLSSSATQLSQAVTTTIKDEIQSKISSAPELVQTTSETLFSSLQPSLQNIVDLNLTTAFSNIHKNLKKMEEQDPQAFLKFVTQFLEQANTTQVTSRNEENNKDLNTDLVSTLLGWAFPENDKSLKLPDGLLTSGLSAVVDIKALIFEKIKTGVSSELAYVFTQVTDHNFMKEKVIPPIINFLYACIDSIDTSPKTGAASQKTEKTSSVKFPKKTIPEDQKALFENFKNNLAYLPAKL
jgi:hypothetical protein